MRCKQCVLWVLVLGVSILAPVAAGASGGKAGATCGGLPVDPAMAAQATEGDDVIKGTPGDDVINGLGGDDVVYGYGGDDVICGGAGNDTLLGGPGNDELRGDDGNDRIRGAAGDDDMFGGAGSDRLIPELGGGSADGGPGSDIIDYLAADGPVEVRLEGTATYTTPGGTEHIVTVTAVEKVDGSAHDDSIFGDDRRNVLRGKQGDDYIVGFDGDDTLIGGIGADVLFGDAGDDLIKGQAGDDDLYGWMGEDDLVGGPGDDYSWGGPGNDRIRGGRKAEAASSVDIAHGASDDDTCLWAAGAIDCERIVNPPPEAKVCVAFGGESDDGSFNQMAWQGALGTHDLGVYAEALEPDTEADFAPDIGHFVEDGACDLIVTVGFAMQSATAAAATAAPGQDFLVLDVEISGLPNVRSSTFAVQEPSFLAGYLAAGMTATGTVGTFGGIQIPPVTAFMDGFAWGVEHYNSVHAASVTALGWDPDAQAGLFAGGFDQASGETAAQTLIDQGADVILPVAGAGLRGAATRCQSTGSCAVIGVDADAYDSLFSSRDVLLSSVVKGLDTAVADTVGSILRTGSFGSATYVGDLANGGTGLAPFHEFEDDVPQWLKDELAALEAAIVAGTVAVG